MCSFSLAQLVPVQGAVLVTTPQEVSLSDVRRAVKMFETVNVPVLGVIENMSYFIAPDTGNRYEIFGSGGGQKLCDEYGLNFLGEVPHGDRSSRRRRQRRARRRFPTGFAASRGIPERSRRSRTAGFDRSNEAGVGYLDASKVSLPSLNTKDLFATPEIADRRGRNHT